MAEHTRGVLREMFLEALQELDLCGRMRARIRARGAVLDVCDDLYTLDEHRDIRVVAIGKAAEQMAAALDELLGAGRAQGLVVSAAPPRSMLRNFEYIIGGHPYPDDSSLAAAERALRLVSGATERTLMLFLISGGGSAIFEKPLFDDISLEDLAAFNRVLVTRGANIYEMNVLRKHFSAVKGGRLAVAAHPAQQVTIYVSDVPPGQPSTVASGPTMPDESTIEACRQVVERYDLLPVLPEPYRRRIESGEIPETPKPGDPPFANSRYYAVLANADGIDALLRLAHARGWDAEADVSCDDWPLETAADYLLTKLRARKKRTSGPVCLVSGGELSCPVTGPGLGGRNQAFVLSCAMKIEGEPVTVLSAGTDGIDGNSPAAGAVADGETIARARAQGIDAEHFFRQSDSYSFFAALRDEIVTGPTGNNVRDLRILLM